MGERRALVIGAPNDRFGRLTFLDDVVGELHRVVRHPEFGGCAPALPDGRDLLLGAAATRSAMNSALGDAMRAAADDQATLFVYFCGHGYREEPDFYLVASDTEPGCVDSETALPLGQRVKELLRQNATVDGLMLIIDACHSGGLVADPVTGLLREGVHGRIEFLAATRPKQVASKGCFSRSLTARLLAGSPGSPSPEIRAYDEHHRLRDVAPEECRDMPQVVHLSLNGSSDAGLWLGRNRTADLCPALVGTASADLVARLTRDWQRPLSSQLRLMVLLGQCASPIGITGGPGAGKSAFLAWLGRRSAGDLLWLDALVLVRPGDTLALLAPRLEIQLRNVAAYRAAAQRWRQLTPVLHQQAASDFDRQITGPLSHLDTASQVRIGIDAADQLDTVQRRRLLDAVASLPGVAVLLTGRQLDEVPGSATIDLPDRDADGVARLLTAVIDDGTVRKQVADLVSGEWLLARVLTGLWRAGHLPAASPLTKLRDLHAAFNAAITTAQSASPGAPVDEVLSLLAAAPTGAWLPLQVISATLEKADARSPNPSVRRDPEATIVRVRDAVVALGELVARAEPGQTTERIGPAHDLIATYLADRYGDVAVKDAHMAIAESLRAIAPDADPAHGRSYARARLSEHLAACGRTAEALVQLPVLSRPADTLALWNSWHDRIAPLDELRIEVLTTRYNIAHWTGAAGNPAEAVRLLEQLLPEQQRVLGRDHRDVLRTRHSLAYWSEEAENPAKAVRLFKKLLRDQRRVLGPDHRDVLRTRRGLADSTGDAGKPAKAVRLLRRLLPEQQRVLGPDHRDVLRTRHSLARWTGEAGDPAKAVLLLEQLVPEQQRVLGLDHLDVLRARYSLAYWSHKAGNPAKAVRLLEQLLPDEERVLGPDHRDVLITRYHLASWTGAARKPAEAVRLLEQLLPEQQRVLGPDHPDVLTTQRDIAYLTGLLRDR